MLKLDIRKLIRNAWKISKHCSEGGTRSKKGLILTEGSFIPYIHSKTITLYM